MFPKYSHTVNIVFDLSLFLLNMVFNKRIGMEWIDERYLFFIFLGELERVNFLGYILIDLSEYFFIGLLYFYNRLIAVDIEEEKSIFFEILQIEGV